VTWQSSEAIGGRRALGDFGAMTLPWRRMAAWRKARAAGAGGAISGRSENAQQAGAAARYRTSVATTVRS